MIKNKIKHYYYAVELLNAIMIFLNLTTYKTLIDDKGQDSVIEEIEIGNNK